MGETVIVYVTRTGNSRTLAASLGEIIKAPVCEIGDLTNRKGIWGFIVSGSQAARKIAAPIKDPGISLSGVRTVILVQPIWASNLCPPLRTWLQAHHDELSGVRLALVASNLGSPPEKFRANFEKEFGPLVAFTSIAQKESSEKKTAALKEFSNRL